MQNLSADDPLDPKDVGERVVASARWVLLARLGSMTTLWVVSIVLAHLLEKREFGLAGMANIFVSLLILFQDSGLSSALIHRSDRMREALDSAVVYAAVAGIALAGVAVASAPLVGAFFHQHQVTSLVRGLSLVILFRAISLIPQAVLQKELRFRAYAIIILTGSVIQAGTAITLGILGAGPWSPLIGAMALEAWCALLMWPVSGLRVDPRRATWSTLRELLRYGRGLAGASVAHTMTQYVDNAVIARQLGPAPLGAYSIGYQVGKQPLNTITFAGNQLVFPAYAKLRNDLERLRRAYLRSIRFLALAAAPLAFGLAAVSGTFVDAVYGARWHAAAPVISIIALMTFVLTLTASMGEVMKALGRPGWLFPLAMLQLVLVTAAVLALYPHGLTAVAAGVAIGCVLVAIVSTFMTEQLIRVGVRDWLVTPLPAVVAGVAMAGALALTNLGLSSLSAGARLVVDVLEAVGVYLVVLRVIAPARLREFLLEVVTLVGGSKATHDRVASFKARLARIPSD